jgi:hypothetical protein
MQRHYECMRCGQAWEHVNQYNHAEQGEVHGPGE